MITHVGRRELPWERIRAEDPGRLPRCPAPDLASAVSTPRGGSGLSTPWLVRVWSVGPKGPGGRKEVRPGPRPRDSSSCGAGRVSGSSGFGMTQSPRLGPGASSALPIRDSPTVGGFRSSQECPRGGRAGRWFCPIRNVQDSVPSPRVIASPRETEPDLASAWCTLATQEGFVKCSQKSEWGNIDVAPAVENPSKAFTLRYLPSQALARLNVWT